MFDLCPMLVSKKDKEQVNGGFN